LQVRDLDMDKPCRRTPPDAARGTQGEGGPVSHSISASSLLRGRRLNMSERTAETAGGGKWSEVRSATLLRVK
jgi:hypothetical protein